MERFPTGSVAAISGTVPAAALYWSVEDAALDADDKLLLGVLWETAGQQPGELHVDPNGLAEMFRMTTREAVLHLAQLRKNRLLRETFQSDGSVRLHLLSPEVAFAAAAGQSLADTRKQLARVSRGQDEFQFSLPALILQQTELAGMTRLAYARLWAMTDPVLRKMSIVYADFGRHCGDFSSQDVEQWLRTLLRLRLISVIRQFDGGMSIELIDPQRLFAKQRNHVETAQPQHASLLTGRGRTAAPEAS